MFRLDAVRKDEFGFLRAQANATRVGVFKYRKADGSVLRELRHPDEVFSEDSMASLEMVPVTNDHPAERLVTSENAKKYQVGYTGSVKKADPFLQASVVVTLDDAIKAVESGKQELSCGYFCDLDPTPGEFNGEPYDVIQRNIRYNHLAIVSKGRAGPQVRIKLDSADAVVEGDYTIEENETMKKVKLGEKEIELKEDHAEILEAHLSGLEEANKAKLDAASEKTKEAKDACDALQAKLDSSEEKLAAAKKETKLDTSSDEFKSAVKARVSVEAVAAKLLSKETKIDGLSNREVQEACLKAYSKTISLDGKTDAYVEARFDGMLEDIAEKEKSGAKLEEILKNKAEGKNDNETEKDLINDAYQKHIESQKNLYKDLSSDEE